MSVYAYRLFSVQAFKNLKGKKVAVYVCEGNYPDPEIINDALDIINGVRSRREVTEHYNSAKYDPKYSYPEDGRLNRARLTYYTRILKRSQKVLDESGNVEYAIFVNETHSKNWRGERQLYKLKNFDTIKSDTPVYSGTEEAGTILI